jgi:hypothetical protein
VEFEMTNVLEMKKESLFKIILEKKRNSLLEIAKYHIDEMKESNEFELSDFQIFADMLSKFEELQDYKLLPHLVIVHKNMWFGIMDFLEEVMEYLGYEEVGRMSNDFGKVNYKFESNDLTYDCLYRLKSIKADYTKTFKISY